MSGVVFRNRALDGLRGLAATAVVFYHAILHYDLALVDRVLVQPFDSVSGARDFATKAALVIFNGQAAVVLFFVLSGVVLQRSLERDRGTTFGIAIRFAIKRLFRIMPAVVVCMSIFYVLTQGLRYLNVLPFPVFSLPVFLKNALLIETKMHSPSLTVQTELLVVPFILVFYFVLKFFGRGGAMISILFALLAMGHAGLVFRLPNVAPNLFGFLVGMLVADRRCAAFFAGMGMLAIAGLVGAIVAGRHIVGFHSVSGLVAQTLAAAALLGVILYGRPNSAVRLLEGKACQFLGRVSYGTYLFHVVTLYLIWWSMMRYVSLPTVHALELGLVTGLVALPPTLALAFWCERWIEQPGIVAGQLVCDLVVRSADTRTNPALAQ